MSEHIMGISLANMAQTVAMKMDHGLNRMLVVEFVQNAIEHGADLVTIDSVKLNGVPKLRIRNNGVGMTYADMKNHLMDLYSSSKKTGANENRGIGARVTALKGNPCGVIYRSNCGEVVTELTMYRREDGTYACTEPRCIPPTTAGEYSGSEWVETVFLGESHGANTYACPYPGARSVLTLAYDVLKTFYRLPLGFRIQIPEYEQYKQFLSTLEQYLHDHDVRREAVTLPDGITVNYIDTENLGGKQGKSHQMESCGVIRNTPAPCGVVYKNRLYDVVHGKSEWAARALRVGSGLEMIAETTLIIIELPETFHVTPDEYRGAIRWQRPHDECRASIDDEVEYLQFSGHIIKAMPEWVVKRLGDDRQSMRSSASIDAFFLNLMSQFEITEENFKSDPDGDDGAGEGLDQIQHDPDKTKKHKTKSGTTRTPGDKPARKIHLPKKMPDVRFHYLYQDYYPSAFGKDTKKPLYISPGLLGTENDLVNVNMEYPLFKSISKYAETENAGDPMYSALAAEDALKHWAIAPYMASLYVTFKINGLSEEGWREFACCKDNHYSAAAAAIAAGKEIKSAVIKTLRREGKIKSVA